MHCFVVLCLLSAAVALPTSEQLRTNLPVLPLPPELKSEEKENIIHEQVLVDPIPPLLDARGSEEAKNPSESADTPKAEKNEDKDKVADVISVIQKESKESKESKEFDERPEQPKEEKKENDSKYEESKQGDEEDGPIIVEVLQKPSRKDWMPLHYNHQFQLPWPFTVVSDYLSSKLRNGGQRNQPIYIVTESDFAYDGRN